MTKKPARQTRRRAPGPDLRVSPLLAYAEGTSAEAWKTPSPFVAGCIGVAAMLQAAARERSAALRQQLFDRAIDQVTGLLDPGETSLGSSIDPLEIRSVLRPFSSAADRLALVEYVPLTLVGHMLESLAALVPPESVDGGRVLSMRIMYGYDDVHNDLRTDLARQLFGLGFRLRNHELLARACAHLQGRAIVVGNLPLAARMARIGTKHALADGDPRLIAMSLNLRGVVSGMRGDMASSIEQLWEGLQLADHPDLQVQCLANLGETLYRVGRFREARAARAMVLLARHNRCNCISLGGYAACCAAFGDEEGVKWAAGQAMLMASSVSPTRPLAQGLMGCADACGEVGLTDLAKTLYDRGRALADAHGFHDLQFRPDPSVRRRRATPIPLGGGMESMLESIVELAPDGVPTNAVLTW